MHVEVFLDARTGDGSQVHANIEALRCHDFFQYVDRPIRGFHEFRALLLRQGVQRSDLSVRYDHQMASTVWIAIEKDIRRLTSIDDQMGFVFG